MPNTSSLLRWISKKLRPRNSISNGDSSSDTFHNGASTDTVVVDDNPFSSGVECYACTQVGVPVFHSTSCDSAYHQLQWEASAGSSLVPIQSRPKKVLGFRTVSGLTRGPFGRVLDPRSKRVQRWNRALLLARGVVFWLIVPKLLREEKIKIIMTIMLLIFLFQFLPKVYHSICMMRRMQKVTGYIFGTIWWGFGLNLIAYFIASHVAGGCWYVLAIQRVASCLRQQCERTNGCNLSVSCSEEICYQSLLPASAIADSCGGNSTVVRKPLCLDVQGPFKYGIYQWALPVISSNSLAVKILYPIFWGLMTLSTFGNDLEPTSNWLEVIFSICIVLSGLLLFTLLIGNIQVFLHAVMAKKRKMQLRCRDMEWWMRRRQLPSRLRQRVRHFERQRWAAMGGEDEMEMIKDLPEGLRRDIKRHLCLDLIRKVPLFHNMDDLILDNICDRVKPLVFSKDEKIIREGDPVPRMVFVVRGRIKRNQSLSKGMVASSILDPGGFLGDELLSWCLRRPFIDRLPASSATFVCLESAEAFGLDANNLRYITDHFRYKFANERLKRTARYYSSNWRTWAAVNIQFAWRRYRQRTKGPVIPVRDTNGGTERRLLQYAALFMSLRPHDHLE
ncbi:hypothetical protein JHK85_022769 [Glycine max]|nr:hypothetical protein JHK85_022769 [Glycine max]